MSKIKLKKSDFLNVFILSLVGALLMVLGMIAIGNQPEIYNDYVIETVAYSNMNMSGELKVFWIILIVGVVGLLFLSHFLKRIKSDSTEKVSTLIKIETALGVANLIYLAIAGNMQIALTFAMIITFFNSLVSPKKLKEGLILNIVTFMSIYGGITAINWLGVKLPTSGVVILLVSAVLDIIVLAIDRRKEILNRVLLVLQILVPLGLLGYVNERYILNGATYKVGYSLPIRILFAVVILAMIGWVIYRLVRKWNGVRESLKKIILFPTLAVTFLVASVGPNTGLILPFDLHHKGEDIISYQQIIDEGQKAYVDYSPVSGLFPVFIGGTLEAVGGEMTEYNIASAIFIMIMAAITIWLLTKHLGMDDCLIIACCFIFTAYNRTVWMPMTMLILLLPRLIEKRNLWLKVWILIIMAQGIYYPSFGGAALIGTLPIGIWQIVQMAKSGELKKRLKDWKFYLGWGVCLAPVVACAPLLLRLAKHVALYAKQTTLADGIAVFGQSTPSDFMPYLNDGAWLMVKQSAYYAIRYVIPMIVIWLLIMLLIKAWKKRKESLWPVWTLLTLVIMLVVAYSGTMVRQDWGGMVGRAISLIIPTAGVLLLVVLRKYVVDNIYKYILIGAMIGTALICGYSPLARIAETTKYANVITGDYVQITQEMKDTYPRLGDGFIRADSLAMIEDFGTRAKELLKYDENLKFIGWGELGVYYVLDIPTVGQPSLYAAKDYATNQEIIDAVKKQRPVIGLYIPNINPGLLTSYYFYNWLYTTDDYVYDDSFKAFLPIELFKKIHGDNAVPDPKTKAELKSTYEGKVSASLGASIESLEKNVLTERNISEVIGGGHLNVEKREYTYEVQLPEGVAGDDADMIYIDFDVNGNIHNSANSSGLKKLFSKQEYNEDILVFISWGKGDDNKTGGELGRGDLLITAGANSNWLMNKHESFKITIQNVDEPIKINDIKFYQLKKQ